MIITVEILNIIQLSVFILFLMNDELNSMLVMKDYQRTPQLNQND